MKLIYGLTILALLSLIPALEQTIFADEDDDEREHLAACKKAVNEDDSLTFAEKSVERRNCDTNYINSQNVPPYIYQNNDQMKSLIQHIQSCLQWHPQYQYLSIGDFEVEKRPELVTYCIMLYEDPVWNYVGEDRIDKLVQRLIELKKDQSEINAKSEISPVQLSIPNNPLVEKEDKLFTGAETAEEKIDLLQERVTFLEEQLSKKNEVIKEQIKVIMDLANRVKVTLFEPFFQYWNQI